MIFNNSNFPWICSFTAEARVPSRFANITHLNAMEWSLPFAVCTVALLMLGSDRSFECDFRSDQLSYAAIEVRGQCEMLLLRASSDISPTHMFPRSIYWSPWFSLNYLICFICLIVFITHLFAWPSMPWNLCITLTIHHNINGTKYRLLFV